MASRHIISHSCAKNIVYSMYIRGFCRFILLFIYFRPAAANTYNVSIIVTLHSNYIYSSSVGRIIKTLGIYVNILMLLLIIKCTVFISVLNIIRCTRIAYTQKPSNLYIYILWLTAERETIYYFAKAFCIKLGSKNFCSVCKKKSVLSVLRYCGGNFTSRADVHPKKTLWQRDIRDSARSVWCLKSVKIVGYIVLCVRTTKLMRRALFVREFAREWEIYSSSSIVYL